MPADARQFALDHCIFVSVGSSSPAQVLPPTDRWTVLLEEGQPSVTESVVAHEVAHAWLGHEGQNTDEQERDARSLARSWGFTGLGADDVK